MRLLWIEAFLEIMLLLLFKAFFFQLRKKTKPNLQITSFFDVSGPAHFEIRRVECGPQSKKGLDTPGLNRGHPESETCRQTQPRMIYSMFFTIPFFHPSFHDFSTLHPLSKWDLRCKISTVVELLSLTDGWSSLSFGLQWERLQINTCTGCQHPHIKRSAPRARPWHTSKAGVKSQPGQLAFAGRAPGCEQRSRRPHSPDTSTQDGCRMTASSSHARRFMRLYWAVWMEGTFVLTEHSNKQEKQSGRRTARRLWDQRDAISERHLTELWLY